jgi:hypothetical protein
MPVGEVVRHQRSCTYDAASMNQEPSIDSGLLCPSLHKLRATVIPTSIFQGAPLYLGIEYDKDTDCQETFFDQSPTPPKIRVYN